MKKKLLDIWNYLLSGFLGFWSLAFMASSGVITKNVSWIGANRSSAEMYDLISFNGGAALSAAAVFQIFMIIISAVLLLFALVQVLKLHGAKIPYLDKVFEVKVTIKNKKDFHITTLLVFAYILFSLLTIICLAVFASKNSIFINSTNYTKRSVGFGPIWLFLSAVIIGAKMVFKDEVLAIWEKVTNKAKGKASKEEPKTTDSEKVAPAKKQTAKKEAVKADVKKEVADDKDVSADKEVAAAKEETPAEEKTPVKKEAPKKEASADKANKEAVKEEKAPAKKPQADKKSQDAKPEAKKE